MAKKIVKPIKKVSNQATKKAVAKPAPKKAVAKPAKKVSKPDPKPVAKKLVAKKPTAKKVVAKKPVPKPALKKVTKVPAKKVVKAAKPAPKQSRPSVTASKKVEKKLVKPAAKVTAKPAKKIAAPAKPTKAVKEIAKPKVVGKPIDAVAKKGAKPSKKAAKTSKIGKKGDEHEEDDIEPEEEDDSDVDVKDDYEKPDDDDVVVDLDEAPVLDLEGGGIPLDDDDDDEIPEKRGRGRRKKNEGRSSGSESYIRNRPLHIDITKPLIKKPQAAQPKPFLNTKDDRSRYSDKELGEFKDLIIDKLKEAQADYDLLKQTLSNADNHGTDDTSPSFKLLEDGSDVLSKEETAQLAVRQEKYIVNLKNALMRIENKTYGICRVTGKLIPKERLRSVPHATLGIDAKLNQSS
jgi:RNA polymerase-binding transcription factor DksA